MLLLNSLTRYLFKIHECFWILSGTVEPSKSPLMHLKTPAGVHVPVQRHLHEKILVKFSPILSVKSSEASPRPLSPLFLFRFCVQTHYPVSASRWRRETCPCAFVCVSMAVCTYSMSSYIQSQWSVFWNSLGSLAGLAGLSPCFERRGNIKDFFFFFWNWGIL